jgi:hypothetical protein
MKAKILHEGWPRKGDIQFNNVEMSYVLEALAKGALASGRPRPKAMSLALQQVKGAATMAQETGLHPGRMKDAVESHGETTIAGIHALEGRGFKDRVNSAEINASKRSAEPRKLVIAKKAQAQLAHGNSSDK